MGLPSGFLQLLFQLHARNQFAPPVLTLGVQDVYATYEQLQTMIVKAGLPPRDLPPEERELTTSYLLKHHILNSDPLAHSRTLFRLMGLGPCESLDASNWESPTLVHDLNQPIPRAWHGRYGLILDGGTTEHLFDVRAAFSNLVRLLRVGGQVIHFSPVSGWINHGFFQPSPCLFYDFYLANGFQVREAYLLLFGPTNSDPTYVQRYRHTPGRLQLKHPNAGQGQMVNLVFVASKVIELDEIRVPTQAKYSGRMDTPAPAEPAMPTADSTQTSGV